PRPPLRLCLRLVILIIFAPTVGGGGLPDRTEDEHGPREDEGAPRPHFPQEPADWPSDELDEDTLEVPPDEVDVDRANRFVASPALLSPTRQAAP
ncbi:unnamed protein product, partial [Prorocentrum cordatum]